MLCNPIWNILTLLRTSSYPHYPPPAVELLCTPYRVDIMVTRSKPASVPRVKAEKSTPAHLIEALQYCPKIVEMGYILDHVKGDMHGTLHHT